jgi:hypothetical protein
VQLLNLSHEGGHWHHINATHFRILSGKSDMGLYQFDTLAAKHYFCKYCGINPFIRPRIAPAMWTMNLCCVDGIDLANLKIQPFGGQIWETAAQRFMRAQTAI